MDRIALPARSRSLDITEQNMLYSDELWQAFEQRSSRVAGSE